MSIDLKPLSKEVIQKMGHNTHDLWVVKLDDEIYGPFEVESLKHYATENEKVFLKAQASRMDTTDWHPFFDHAHFQDIQHSQPEVIVKYWALINGQKVGPLSKMDIDKKLEMDILNLSDYVSVDEGLSWHKFYQLEAFNAAVNSTMDDLPHSPNEASFQKAKLLLADKLEIGGSDDSQMSLAALAHMGRSKDKITLNLEDIDLKSLNQTEVSRSLRWAIPTAMAGVSFLAFLGYALLTPSTSQQMAMTEEISQNRIPAKVVNRVAPQVPRHIPQEQMPRPIIRKPASYQPVHHNQRSALTSPPDVQEAYPTHVETHQYEAEPVNDYDQMDPRNDTRHDQRIEHVNNEAFPLPEAQQEHSLLTNNVVHEAQDGGSLDQAMMDAANGNIEPLPEVPMVEEASDF